MNKLAPAIGNHDGGSPDGFDLAFSANADDLLRYFVRRVGESEGSDLLAETWIRAQRSREAFRGEWRSARPWLFGVARHVLADHWQAVRQVASNGDTPFDPWPEVDAAIVAEAAGPLLKRALASLEARDREVLLLHAWEYLTPQEIAKVLEIRPGTARSRLHRARKQLRAYEALAASDEPQVGATIREEEA